MKFLCLAYEEEEKLNGLTQDDWHALRQEVLDYVARLSAEGKLISTHALRSAREAATVRVRNGKVAVTDGPFAEAKEHIGGFFLIEAQDAKEARAIAAAWPSARIGSIEVRPVEEELRMERRYS